MLQNSTCEACGAGSYYEESSKTCKTCQGLCTECTSASNCTKCAPHSNFLMPKTCTCDQGYSGTTSCERNYFTAVVEVFQNNSIKLVFAEPLQTVLSEKSLEVSVGGIDYRYEIKRLDPSDYLVVLSGSVYLGGGARLLIKFLVDVVSTHNSLLSRAPLESTLFVKEENLQQDEIQTEATKMKSSTSTRMIIVMMATLGISLMSFDFACFFNFMNTSEMFYSIYLLDLKIYPVISSMLLGMRIETLAPNVFSHIVDIDYGGKIPEKYMSYGYKSNLFLLNAGVRLTAVAFFISIWLVIAVLCISSTLAEMLRPITRLFKYSVFLRLWVQMMLELLVTASLGISYYDLSINTQISDLIFAASVLVRDM